MDGREVLTKEVDEQVARELEIHANNDAYLYRIQEAWAKNFKRKMNRGVFDKDKAVQGLANNYVRMIIASYNKQFGSVGGPVNRETKLEIARSLLPGILEIIAYQPMALKIQRQVEKF